MWLRVLRLGGYLGLSAWPLNTITSVPVREKRAVLTQRSDGHSVTTGEETEAMQREAREGPKLQALEERTMDSP